MKKFGCLQSVLAVSSMVVVFLSTTSTGAAASPSQQRLPPNRSHYMTPHNSAKDDDLWYYRYQFVEFIKNNRIRPEGFNKRDIREFTRQTDTDPIPHRWGEALDAFAKEGAISKEGEYYKMAKQW